MLGFFYLIAHSIFTFLATYIVLFSNNLKSLIIVGIMLNLNFIYALWTEGCPLTRLERERLGDDLISIIARKLPLNFTDDKRYSITMQLLITGICLYAIKIMGLLCFREFLVK